MAITGNEGVAEKAANLLAEYEDTGLTPNEVEELIELKTKAERVILDGFTPCNTGMCDIKEERDKAIEEIKHFAGARGMPGICSTCKHQNESSLSDSCVKCNGSDKRGYEWHGLKINEI